MKRMAQLAPLLLLASACSGESPSSPAALPDDGGPLVVVAVNYPLAYLAERIGGDEVDVRLPAPPDVDPAFWSPTADEIATMQSADLILQNGAGYAAWMRTATLPGSRIVDTSAAFADRLIELDDQVTHTHGPEGDHQHGTTAFTTWLDPELLVHHATAVRDALIARRPQAEDAFFAHAEPLMAEIGALDIRMERAVGAWGRRAVIFSHPVYQYFERRSGANGHSVHWEPDAPPTDEEWTALDALVATDGAKWMIWEGEPLPETVAALEKRGIGSIVFAPCGNRPETGDLMSHLTAGAAALETVYDSTD